MKFRERVLKLYLLGFDIQEIVTTLTLDTKRKVSEEEVVAALNEARELLSALPSIEDIRAEVGQALERAKMFQKDLLAIYQNMLRNYNAMLEGLTEHEDGTPVIGVRPTDIAAMADRIMRIDQERVNALINTVRTLGSLAPTPALPAASDVVSVSDLVVEVLDDKA